MTTREKAVVVAQGVAVAALAFAFMVLAALADVQ